MLQYKAMLITVLCKYENLYLYKILENYVLSFSMASEGDRGLES